MSALYSTGLYEAIGTGEHRTFYRCDRNTGQITSVSDPITRQGALGSVCSVLFKDFLQRPARRVRKVITHRTRAESASQPAWRSGTMEYWLDPEGWDEGARKDIDIQLEKIVDRGIDSLK